MNYNLCFLWCLSHSRGEFYWYIYTEHMLSALLKYNNTATKVRGRKLSVIIVFDELETLKPNS